MGEVLQEGRPEVGIVWGEDRLGPIAYADELILLADTPGDLQRKLDGLCKGLQQAGMSLNIKKISHSDHTKGWQKKASGTGTKHL